MERLVAGNNPSARKRKYEQLNDRIYCIAQQYDVRTKTQYLSRIAYNFTM